jgi:hypothetical protein
MRDVGPVVRRITSKKFREDLAEQLRKSPGGAPPDIRQTLRQHLADGMPVPVEVIPRIFEELDRKRRPGRPKQTRKPPAQAAHDLCAFLAVLELLRNGWNQSNAAETVGQLMGLSRQGVLKQYDRVVALAGSIQFLPVKSWSFKRTKM